MSPAGREGGPLFGLGGVQVDPESLTAYLAAANPYFAMHGFRVTALAEDSITLSVELRKDMKNPYGTAHGGVYFTMADCCAGITARTDGRTYVTMDAHIHYLKGTSSGVLTAVSRVIRRGRHSAVIAVDEFDGDGELLVTVTVTMYCVDNA